MSKDIQQAMERIRDKAIEEASVASSLKRPTSPTQATAHLKDKLGLSGYAQSTQAFRGDVVLREDGTPKGVWVMTKGNAIYGQGKRKPRRAWIPEAACLAIEIWNDDDGAPL
jgi:hypothetical protein